MDLGTYFENFKGTGVMATADDQGRVDVAVYARPHIMDQETIAFIMPDRLTHHNLQSNNHAAYLFMRLRRRPRPWPWWNALMHDIPFQQSSYHASADFAHRRMTHRSLGVGWDGFGGPRACPWGSMKEGPGYKGIRLFLTKVREEEDSELLRSIRRRKYATEKGEEEESRFLVFFKVDKVLPLIGAGEEST
jgi:hypothetical protein